MLHFPSPLPGVSRSVLLHVGEQTQTCLGFPGGARGKEPTCQCRRLKRCSFNNYQQLLFYSPMHIFILPIPLTLKQKYYSQLWNYQASFVAFIHFITVGLPPWLSDKESTCSSGDLGDAGLIPGLRRSSVGGNGHPLQYSCLENPMDRGAWRATVHRVTKSWTWLKQLSTHMGEETQTCFGNNKRYSITPQREKTFLEWGFQIGKL